MDFMELAIVALERAHRGLKSSISAVDEALEALAELRSAQAVALDEGQGTPGGKYAGKAPPRDSAAYRAVVDEVSGWLDSVGYHEASSAVDCEWEL